MNLERGDLRTVLCTLKHKAQSTKLQQNGRSRNETKITNAFWYCGAFADRERLWLQHAYDKTSGREGAMGRRGDANAAAWRFAEQPRGSGKDGGCSGAGSLWQDS